MTRLVALCLVGMVIGTGAEAAGPPMPSYDVSAFCAGTGGVTLGEKECVTFQYMLREGISTAWVNASSSVRTECIAASR